jgi:hypothetical protein
VIRFRRPTSHARAVAGRRNVERGQGLIEFALILPLFAVLLLGVLELGTAFSHHLSLEYATREGARSGSALANGGGALGCGSGQSPKASTVDPLIIEAVERVLTSPGSPIVLSSVTQIRIYKSTASGAETPGLVNVWTYSLGGGPTPVDSTDPLDFKQSGATGWTVCSRSNANPADVLGVSITYTYTFTTGLTQVLSMIGVTTGPVWTMSDRTVMNLNPTSS